MGTRSRGCDLVTEHNDRPRVDRELKTMSVHGRSPGLTLTASGSLTEPPRAPKVRACARTY